MSLASGAKRMGDADKAETKRTTESRIADGRIFL
jgi:hypothetical protein